MATNTQLINGVYHTSFRELGGGSTESVLYVEQELTATQQAQARTNIGVAGATEVAYLGSTVGTA